MMTQIVAPATSAPPLTARWDDASWLPCQSLDIDQFHPRGSPHKPRTQLKVCYDRDHLCLIYRVDDRYVLARNTTPQSPVYKDSCVEAFLQPGGGRGYVNVEVNAGGTVLCSHITDHVRTPTGFRAFQMLTAPQISRIQTSSTLPREIFPERPDPTRWELALRIPFALLTELTGAGAPQAGTIWHANFFKCADESSHPHWASWSPIGTELNFHQPAYFGRLQFA